MRHWVRLPGLGRRSRVMLAPTPLLLPSVLSGPGLPPSKGKRLICGSRLKLYLLTEDGAGRAPALKAPSPGAQARTSFL